MVEFNEISGKHGQAEKNGDQIARQALQILEVTSNLAIQLNPSHVLSHPVTLDSKLDHDLGLDSLGRVELLINLEKTFNVSIPGQVLNTAETPRDLLRAILESHGRKAVNISRDVEELSLGEAPEVPNEAKTLVEVLEWHVASHPDRPHIRLYNAEGEGEVITYQELLEGAKKTAAGLQALGLEPQEHVIIMLPTGREYFYSFMGILLVGAVPVPVYPPGRLSQIEEHLRRHISIANIIIAWQR